MHQRKRRSVYGKADLDTTRFVEIVLVNDFDIVRVLFSFLSLPVSICFDN